MKALLVVIALTSLASAKFDYSGYKVFRITAETEDQRQLLQKLEGDFVKYDFWSDVNRLELPVDIMVGSEFQEEFLMIIDAAGMKTDVYIDNVQQLVESQERSVTKTRNADQSIDWISYHTLENIQAWLRHLAAENSDRVTVQNAGTTYEGRDILGVKISYGPGRRAVFVEGGIHAREWISPATVTYIINEVINTKDPEFRRIAESFDWYLFPNVNPDGYVYSHESYRLWRKSRSPVAGICRGIDGNRNWDIHWGVAGTSSLPCSATYGGTEPFSEPEISQFADYINTVGNDLDVYLAFHSYSQILLLPYGHTRAPLDNYEQAMRIGRKAISSLREKHGTVYSIGNIGEAIYLASGGSIDWVKDRFKVALVYTYELRDRGFRGFLLPSSQIIPNNEEVMESIKTIFQEGAAEGLWNLR